MDEKNAKRGETWLRTQNRGLPEGIGIPFDEDSFLPGLIKTSIEKDGSQDGAFFLCPFWGERSGGTRTFRGNVVDRAFLIIFYLFWFPLGRGRQDLSPKETVDSL